MLAIIYFFYQLSANVVEQTANSKKSKISSQQLSTYVRHEHVKLLSIGNTNAEIHTVCGKKPKSFDRKETLKEGIEKGGRKNSGDLLFPLRVIGLLEERRDGGEEMAFLPLSHLSRPQVFHKAVAESPLFILQSPMREERRGEKRGGVE